MKYIFIATILIILSSCSKIYHHYIIVNNSSKEIFVKIETFGGEYQEYLEYLIKSGETKFIFEHPDYEIKKSNSDYFSKHIKRILIMEEKSRLYINKEFTKSNFNHKYVSGILGKYQVWEFVINECDIEKPNQ